MTERVETLISKEAVEARVQELGRPYYGGLRRKRNIYGMRA